MKRKISKVLLSLFFFVSIANICSAQNTARGIAAEKIAVEQKDEVKRNEPRLYFSTGQTYDSKSVVYTPNGKYIITDNKNCIIIWDSISGKEIKKIDTRGCTSVCCSPDSKYIASGYVSGIIRIWDIETGKEVKKLEDCTDKSMDPCSYSFDGKYLVGKQAELIIIWNIETEKKVKKFEGHTEIVRDVDYSPDLKYIASASDDKTIRIWNIETGKELKKIEGHTQGVYTVSYSPDGRYLISGGNDKSVRMWDIETGKEIRKFDGHTNTVLSSFFISNGKYIVSGSRDKSVIIWNAETGEKIKYFKCKESISNMALSPNEEFIAISCYYGILELWNIEKSTVEKNLSGFITRLGTVVCSPDGMYVASATSDGKIRIYDMQSGILLKIFQFSEKQEHIISYCKDGKHLAISSGSSITILDLKSEEKKTIYAGVGKIECFYFCLDEKYIITGDSYGFINKVDIEKNKIIKNKRFVLNSIPVFTSIACSQKGKYMALGFTIKKAELWDVITWKKIRDLNTGWSTHSLSFSSDEQYVSYVDRNLELNIEYINTGTKYFKDGYFSGMCICYSPNGKDIAIGKFDCIEVVDTRTFASRKLETGHVEYVTSISYSQNGKYVVGGIKSTGTIKVWDAETGLLIYTIVNGKNGEYLTYTPEGFFTGTEWAMKNLVHIVDGMDVIGIDQVYDKLYRPDLVAAKMRGEDISEYTKEVNLASIVRSGNAPAVAIKNLPELSDSRDVTFDVCVQNTGGGIGNVSIVLNGKTIQLSEGVASSRGEQKIFRHTVTLKNGQNKIEAFAMNSAGMIESRRASADVNWQGKTSKPNLYVLTVAVNKYRDKDLWLNYCVSDAASIEESFKKQKNGLYENICVYSLKDAEVTKEGLEQKFKELSSIVTADDVFVFFVSGHGTAYDDGDYYFIPVNFRYTNKTDIPLNAISKSDLTKNLSLIKAGKTLMMLDTCNSGAFFADSNKRGMGDKGIFERLSRATGHAILAAASDSQSAMEGYNGHGVFTYVLLDGLAGNADSDGDGFVTLTELSSYVENQVPELSYEKWGYEQVPQKELRRQDFPIAEKLSE